MTCRQGLHIITEWRNPTFSVKSDHLWHSSMLWSILAIAVLISLGAMPLVAKAQQSTVVGTNLQKLANSVITPIGYSLVPDVTTARLLSTGNPQYQPLCKVKDL